MESSQSPSPSVAESMEDHMGPLPLQEPTRMALLNERSQALVEQVRQHPYQALLVAAGVGYILGGGLFSRLTLSVVRTGLRMGALPMVQRTLIGALTRSSLPPAP
jgi:hypothetical protein